MKRSRYLALFFCLAVMGLLLPAAALAGWQAQTATPAPAQAFNAVSGTATTKAFAVGDLGQIYLTTNGTTWTPMTSGTTLNLYGVWNNMTNNAIAVGENGTILRLTTAWAAVTSPTTNFLNAVWGVPAGNPIFAVGDTDPITGFATILQSIDNGATWTAMTTPPAAGAANAIEFSLYGVWGTSATDVYAVGDSGVIAHYNGTAWSYMAGATPGMNPFNLYAVWGSGPTDVFAVGDGGTILHYDGNVGGQWAFMSSPTWNTLNSVWGSSPQDVFAVGDNGTILHYDGINWTLLPNAGATLNGLWGASAANYFAVGNAGTVLGYTAKFALGVSYPAAATGLQFYNGTTWKKIGGTPTSMSSYGYNLVAVYAAPIVNPGIYLYNGTTWTKITTNGASQNVIEYNGSLYVDYGTAGIWKYNGLFGTWSRLTTSDPTLMTVAGNQLYASFTTGAVTTQGLYKWDGVKWTKISATTTIDSMLAIGNNLYVDFGVAGVYVYDGYWNKIHTANPTNMASFGNLLTVNLATGLYTYDFRLDNPLWTLINALPATTMLGVSNSLYANFAATGLSKYTPGATPWTALNAASASLMASRGDNLDALIPAVGIVEYPNNATTGTTINVDATATAMVGVMLR